MLSNGSSEAGSEARDHRCGSAGLAGDDPQGMFGFAVRSLNLSLPVASHRSGLCEPAFVKKRIKEICETHVRYGYRRVYYIQRRDGWHVNMKKVYRLYRELGLQLRNKTPKRG